MKATYSALMLAAVSFAATAQKVENDDMYFTAKDRAQLQTSRVVVDRSTPAVQQVTGLAKSQTNPQEGDVELNPTDSYSARNVNPEYSANATKQGTSTNGDYFIENYRPTGVNGNLNGNYSGNTYASPSSYYYNNPYAYNPYSPYGNPYSAYGSMGWGYPTTGYGMGMGGFGSPYGYGSSMSLMYGMGYGYSPYMMNSMAFRYGYSPYGMMYDPFMMSGMYNPYSFYGYASPYNSYYYPGTLVVDNSTVNGRTVAHTRRSDRSSTEQYQATDTRPAVTQSRTGRSLATNGRTRSTEGTQPYYERGWKNRTDHNGTSASTNRSAWSNPGSANQSSGSRYDNSGRTSSGSSWGTADHNSGSNWGGTNSGSSWNTGGSRSSWNGGTSGGYSGGARTSGGGGGGGGHTRGRD